MKFFTAEGAEICRGFVNENPSVILCVLRSEDCH